MRTVNEWALLIKGHSLGKCQIGVCISIMLWKKGQNKKIQRDGAKDPCEKVAQHS